ncbi:hypothetical protein Tco_0055713, partial [Tanacetum coccineum]
YEVEGPSSTTPGILFPAGQSFTIMTHGNSVPPSVIDDLGVRMGNLEYEHGALVMVSQAVQEMSRLEEIETRVQQLRTRLVEMESRESTLMSYMLWMEERLAVLEKKLPGPPTGPQ